MNPNQDRQHQYSDDCNCKTCEDTRLDVCLEIFKHEGFIEVVGHTKEGAEIYRMTQKGHHLAVELPKMQKLYEQQTKEAERQ